MKRILTLLVLVTLIASRSFASTKEAAERLVQELQTAAKDLPESDDKFFATSALREIAATSDDQWASRNENSVVRQLAVHAPNERIRQAAAALLEEVNRARTEREAAKVWQITTVMTDALRAGLAADKVESIDEPLATVSRLLVAEPEESRSPQIQKLLQEAQSLTDFLRRLQDLLGGIVTNPNAAQELSQWQQPRYDFSNLVPRSQILARVKALVPEQPPAPKPIPFPSPESSGAQIDSIIAGIKSLDDLDAAEAEIGKLPLSVRQATFGPLAQLESIIRTYQQIKNGSTSTATLAFLTNQSASGAAGSSVQLARLTALVINYGLPRALQLPPTLAPEVAENRLAYFERIMKLAKEQKDWALLARLIDASQKIGMPLLADANDTNGYTSFLGGVNQEKAHQYTFAVISYLAALGSGSRAVPVEYLGERLDQIKKEHPEEYERGVAMALPPPKEPAPGPAGNRPQHNPNARDRTPILAPPQTVSGDAPR